MPLLLEPPKNGRVITNEMLQSTKLDSMFAVGCGTTCTNAHMENMKIEAAVVAKNVAQRCRGETAITNTVGKLPMASTQYMHFGLGQYGIMNLPGCAGIMSRLCGCCGPCPCCFCCGWCCSFPASKLQSKMLGHVVTEKMGHQMKMHAPDANAIDR